MIRDGRMLIFFLVVVALSTLLHGYLGWRLIETAALSPTARAVAWSLLGAHAVAMPCTFLLLPQSGARWADLLQWVGYVLMGFWSLLFAFTLLRDVGWLGALALSRLSGHDLIPHDPARRAALLRVLTGAVLAVSGGVGGAALVRSRRLAEVVALKIPVAGLPPALHGFRIAQISDLHVGPTIRKAQMEEVVAVVNSLQADLVAVTGDLIDGPVDRLAPHVAPLAGLRGRHGVWFCTGNHEYYSGVDAWTEHCAGPLGMTVLNDAHAVIEHGGARIVVGGVTDLTAPAMHPAHHSSPTMAFAGAPAGDLRILLAHQPESAYEASRNGVHLQLSGHTHGGQYIPFSWLIRLVKPFVKGLYSFRGMWVYVNPGTTYWGPPMRLGSPQEITLLELVAAETGRG
jgi:predicted MPP superfamily phosphohydrolase